jgi:phiKZ-like phage internal head proteins
MRNLGLVAAMEAELETGEVSAAAELPEAADMLETQELGAGVDEQLGAIDSASDDADTLGDIADVMEESAENGGMDETSARVAEVAIESIYKRLGITKKAALPAMESFGDKASRLTATRVAIESIGGQLKKIWEAIKSAFVRVGDWVRDFHAKLDIVNKKLGERAAKALAAAEKVDGGAKPKETEIKAGGFAVALCDANGKVEAVKVVAGIMNYQHNFESEKGAVREMINFVHDCKDLTSLVKSKESFEKIETPVFTFAGAKEASDRKAAEGMRALVSEEFPGNQALIYTVPKAVNTTGADGCALIGKMSISKGAFNQKATKHEIAVVTTLTGPYMVNVATSVLRMSEAITKHKGFLDKLQTEYKALLGEISKAATAIKEDDKEASARAKSVQGMLRGLNKLNAQVSTSLESMAISSGKAALDYVEKSMGQYSATKAE